MQLSYIRLKNLCEIFKGCPNQINSEYKNNHEFKIRFVNDYRDCLNKDIPIILNFLEANVNKPNILYPKILAYASYFNEEILIFVKEFEENENQTLANITSFINKYYPDKAKLNAEKQSLGIDVCPVQPGGAKKKGKPVNVKKKTVKPKRKKVIA